MANLVQILLLANCGVNIPLALTAIIGNALVLHAVWKTPSLRSPSILLLCGLASTDLAVGVVVQPLFITRVLVLIYTHSVEINTLFFLLYCHVLLCTNTNRCDRKYSCASRRYS